jgi:hypothetical protein
MNGSDDFPCRASLLSGTDPRAFMLALGTFAIVSAVAREIRTARDVAALGSDRWAVQADPIDGDPEKRRRWAVQGSTSL